MAGRDGGSRRATIGDVALRAGVSIGTVSRVLNDTRNVGADLRARVAEAALALQYAPDLAARSMRSKRTGVVGMVVPDIQNPLSSAAVAGVEDQLSRQGYTLLLANSRYDGAREARILDEYERRRTDGVVAMVARDEDQATVERLRRLSVPSVLIEREMGDAFDAVRTDQVAGTYRATRYLIGLGHARIGLVTVPRTNMSGRHRVAGFRRAFEDAGLSVPDDLVRTDGFGRGYALDAAYAVLIVRPRPTALLVSGGLLSGVLEAGAQLNLAIPAQLSLITLGDTELAMAATPGITAVRYDWSALGRGAAKLLGWRIAGGTGPAVREILPYEIVMRGSCAARDDSAPGDAAPP